MQQWSYPGLKIAPGRYSGSLYTDDLVIAGHNYARHFSPLTHLTVGTEVLFVDMNDNTWHYAVSDTEVLQPTQIEEMAVKTPDSNWDLTLFTCTTTGQARYALRCVRTDEWAWFIVITCKKQKYFRIGKRYRQKWISKFPQKTVCRTSLPLKAAPAVVPCECRRVFSIRQQPFREQLLFLPLSLRLIPFLMESHILKLVIFSQPILFRTDTNIAFQKVGILFVHVRTVLLNLSTERRTCLSLFRWYKITM